MRKLARIGTTLVTVGAVVAGLGVSAASGETLSKKAYLKAANAVCTTTNKSLETVFNKVFEGVGQNDTPSDAQVEAAVSEAVPIFRKGLDDIDALEGPTAVDTKIGKGPRRLQQGARQDRGRSAGWLRQEESVHAGRQVGQEGRHQECAQG